MASTDPSSETSCRDLALRSLGPSLEKRFEDFRATHPGPTDTLDISDEELSRQILGEGRGDLITYNRLWARPDPRVEQMDDTIYPERDYDPSSFDGFRQRAIQREHNASRVIAGLDPQAVAHILPLPDHSVTLPGNPAAPRLSELDATERYFAYLGTLPDASQGSDHIGFLNRYSRMIYPSPRTVFTRTMDDGSGEIITQSYIDPEIDIVYTRDLLIPEKHSVNLQEGDLHWHGRVSTHAIPYINDFLNDRRSTLESYRGMSRVGGGITALRSHVNQELLRAVQTIGRGITKGEISLKEPLCDYLERQGLHSHTFDHSVNTRVEPEEPMEDTQRALSFKVHVPKKARDGTIGADLTVNLHWLIVPEDANDVETA